MFVFFSLPFFDVRMYGHNPEVGADTLNPKPLKCPKKSCTSLDAGISQEYWTPAVNAPPVADGAGRTGRHPLQVQRPFLLQSWAPQICNGTGLLALVAAGGRVSQLWFPKCFGPAFFLINQNPDLTTPSGLSLAGRCWSHQRATAHR